MKKCILSLSLLTCLSLQAMDSNRLGEQNIALQEIDQQQISLSEEESRQVFLEFELSIEEIEKMAEEIERVLEQEQLMNNHSSKD